MKKVNSLICNIILGGSSKITGEEDQLNRQKESEDEEEDEEEFHEAKENNR